MIKYVDYNSAQNAVLHDGIELQYCSEELKNNQVLVSKAIAKNAAALKFAPAKFAESSDWIIHFLEINNEICNYISNTLWDNYDFCLAIVKYDGLLLSYASSNLKANQSIVLAAVRNNGSALSFASSELGTDREVVLAAFNNDVDDDLLLDFADESLWSDRNFVLAVVSKKGYLLEYASDDFKADQELVLAAVDNSVKALEFASNALITDRDFMLEIVANYSGALFWASDDLQADREVVLAAISNDVMDLYSASNELRANPEIALAAVDNCSNCNYYAYDNGYDSVYACVFDAFSSSLWSNREFVLAVINEHADAIGFVAEYIWPWKSGLWSDNEVVHAFVSYDYRLLEYVSDDLKADPNIVLAAIKSFTDNKSDYDGSYNDLFNIIPESLWSSSEFVLAAVSIEGYALRWAAEELKADPDIVFAAVSNDAIAYYWASDELKAIPTTALAAIKNRSDNCECYDDSIYDFFEEIPESLWSNLNFVLDAVRITESAYDWVNEKYEKVPNIIRDAYYHRWHGYLYR